MYKFLEKIMLYVSGAYGRRYFGPKDAKADWDDGKDFLMYEGGYINKSDWQKYARLDLVYFQSVSPSGDIFSCWLEKDAPL